MQTGDSQTAPLDDAANEKAADATEHVETEASVAVESAPDADAEADAEEQRKQAADPTRVRRTVFVGNLKPAVKESVRSVNTAAAAITRTGAEEALCAVWHHRIHPLPIPGAPRIHGCMTAMVTHAHMQWSCHAEQCVQDAQQNGADCQV